MTCARRAVDISFARICGLLRVEHRAYAQMVADHVEERGAAQSAIETQEAALAARIDIQADTVADLDRRLGEIDAEEAARRGKTNTALSATAGQRRARAAFMDERKCEVPRARLAIRSQSR